MVVAGASLGMVTAALAQETEKERECVCAEAPRVRVGWFGGEGPGFAWAVGRPRLGVMVNTRANPETDRYGALIEEVTPGGPAAKAGIEEGDIITSLAGESLLSGSESYDEDESPPGMRLIERAQNLERGDTVTVELRRDGETISVELVAGEFDGPLAYSFGDSAFSFNENLLEKSAQMRDLAVRLRELPDVEVRAPETFALRLGARLPGLELVSLNPQLGEYFGTDDGVLVVAVPENSELGLEAGDVIEAIDGRDVKSPSHAMRILRSYDADEEVTFTIIRKETERSVTGRVTDPRGARTWMLREREPN